MRVRRTVVATLVMTATLLLVETPAAMACSCRSDVNVAELLAASDGAFVGIYTGRDDPLAVEPVINSGRAVVNHFVVERAVKGEIGPLMEVEAAASGASCGLELEVGERTGLLLRRVDDTWRSALCQQTEPEALLAFAPGQAGPATMGSALLDDLLVVVVGLCVLVAAAMLAFAGLRRRS